jgi:hypothetical protein
MKAKLQALKAISLRAALGAAVAVPVLAHAQASAVSYTSLTSSIDFTTTIAAIMSIAALLCGLYLAIKGAKIVIRMLRGG